MESDQNNPGNSARKPVYPILSNRQIYPGSPGSRKVSPQKDFTGSSNSLTGSDHGGSRKFLNLIHEGAKFCLVQGDQGKKLFNSIISANFQNIFLWSACRNKSLFQYSCELNDTIGQFFYLSHIIVTFQSHILLC